MKTTLLTLCCIFCLFASGWAHNTTENSLPRPGDAIFIGQDPETGDEVMSVGSGNDGTLEQPGDTFNITPEVIWLPKRKDQRRIRPDSSRKNSPRITPEKDAPHIPGTRQGSPPLREPADAASKPDHYR